VSITNYDNIINSLEVIALIQELEQEIEDGLYSVSVKRKQELADQIEDYRVHFNEVVRLSNPEQTEVDFPEYLSIVLSDPDNPLHGAAKGFNELNNTQLYDDMEEFLDAVARDHLHPLYGAAEEYIQLLDLQGQCAGLPDWGCGATLVRWDYFENYAKLLAEDLGAFRDEYAWPHNCIDWDRAARELEQDYLRVSFEGIEYLARG
jgi:hypothetical protein